MKRAVKQPCFWVTVISLVLAAALMLVSILLRPGISAVDKLERGINKGSLDIVASCFPPEMQAELKMLGALGEEMFDIGDAGKLNILYGEVTEDENGELNVQTIMIINRNGQCVEADYEEIDIVEIDGKTYLSSY